MSLAFILGGYLLGSIPFGLLIAKIRKIDIREYGSGNIGATNVLRALGLGPGLIVLLLDLLKGFVPVTLTQFLGQDPWVITLCGLAAVIGHTFPIFLGFKGGRGAATALGMLLGIAPDIFVLAVALFFVVTALTRYVSVGSLSTAVVSAAAFIILARPLPYTLTAALVALLIVLRHMPNIKRLLQGTESRIGVKGE